MASPAPAEIEAMQTRAHELMPYSVCGFGYIKLETRHSSPCRAIAIALATVAAEEREACYRAVVDVKCNVRMHDIDDGGCDCLARAEAAIRARSKP